MTAQKPYLEKTVTLRLFNPNYDQQARCTCGHPYERHFDTHDYREDDPDCVVGCKYCSCVEFTAAADADPILPDDLRRIRNAKDAQFDPDAMSYVRKLLLEVDRLRAKEVTEENGCFSSAIKALEYVGRNGSAAQGGEHKYNTAHLLQIATELVRATRRVTL